MKKEKLNAINNLHKHINKTMPLIIDELKNNTIQFKTDGTLYNKIKDKINKILSDNNNFKTWNKNNLNNTININNWLEFKYNSYKYIEYSICYKNVDSKGNYLNSSYYKKNIRIFYKDSDINIKYKLIDDFIKLPIFTEKQIKNAEKKLNKLNNKITELKKHTSKIESMFLFQI